MECPNCHEEIPDGSRFCKACGAKIDSIENSPTNLDEDIAATIDQPTPEPKPKRSVFQKKPIIAALLILLVACGGYLYYARNSLFIKGDPDKLQNEYYQDIKDAKYDSAYDLLSQVNKDSYTKEDFVLFQNLSVESNPMKDFKVVKVGETKNKELDGNKFDKVIEYDITETLILYADDKKEQSDSYKRYVVAENGNWKCYRPKEDMKNLISEKYYDVGYMFQEGKGETKSLLEAADNYRTAISFDANNSQPYFGLGYVYLQMSNYNDAIKMLEQCINKTGDDKLQKSDTYANLGLCYISIGDRQTAIDCFNKALELNPDNEYAKNGMNLAKH
jgi:tetratricopeptide (TPR) repeat protein